MLLIALPALARTVWEMPTEYPANSMPGEGIATFARLVGRKSGGRLVVQPSYDASKGIKSAGLLAAVRDGRVQAMDASAGALDAVHPIFALSSLPFLATSIEDAKRLADLARPAYEAVLAASGQKLLYVTPWPPSGLWSKRPVSNADELARLSIRTYDATSTAVMRAAGANAANLSFADAVPKLRDGTLDAALSSGDGGAGRRLWEMLPYFTDINYAVPLSLATVSTASYDAAGELVEVCGVGSAFRIRRISTEPWSLPCPSAPPPAPRFQHPQRLSRVPPFHAAIRTCACATRSGRCSAMLSLRPCSRAAGNPPRRRGVSLW